MIYLSRWRGSLLFVFSFAGIASSANAQLFNGPTNSNLEGNHITLDATLTTPMESNSFLINTQRTGASPFESPSGSVSQLDLKAPGAARREFDKGYSFLVKQDYEGAIEHLSKATALYPSFVAAHNALGTAHLWLGHSELARDEFARAVALDDHLPNSFLNLGCAQLGLKQYSDAQESFRKGSAIAPLDVTLLTALTYGEFLNRDYPAVLGTATKVHAHKHPGTAMVHYFAAAAWEAQDHLPEAQREMKTLLQEEPKSPFAPQFRQILLDLQAEEMRETQAKSHRAQTVAAVYNDVPVRAALTARQRAELLMQDMKEKDQIAEAEAQPDSVCAECATSLPAAANSPSSSQPHDASPGSTLRVAVDEVAVFFAATEHGKSVTDLKASDVDIHDDGHPPKTILGFRNESELPLRLGLIIDTSNSVVDRFSFELAAADKFMQTVVTGSDDLSFVIGVNNSVLFAQDFTADRALTTSAIRKLAPGGGTALWDAVAFAAEKLTDRPELQPVARVLVVISDGEDNSSTATLKQAIAKAQQGEVAVYTVSTRDNDSNRGNAELVGDHALRTLSDLTGGATFVPGSVRNLAGSLADLQQVIRGRYLVSYKPDSFKHDGHYRPINIKAEKDGHKIKVYVRKGYYAAEAQPAAPEN